MLKSVVAGLSNECISKVFFELGSMVVLINRACSIVSWKP
jgi:hypothetical protein